jgi:hypothetical protein
MMNAAQRAKTTAERIDSSTSFQINWLNGGFKCKLFLARDFPKTE